MLDSMFLKIRKLLDKVGKSSMGRFGALLAIDAVFPALLLVVLIATFTVTSLLTKSNIETEGKFQEVLHLADICVR